MNPEAIPAVEAVETTEVAVETGATAPAEEVAA